MSSQAFLKCHSHGKLKVRLLKVDRTNPTHQIREITASITLDSTARKSYTNGDNSDVVPTDTMKNTVYCLAKESSVNRIEEFGLTIVEHFLKTYPMVTGIRVDIAEQPWKRVAVDGEPHNHGFVRGGPEYQTVTVYGDERGHREVKAGLKDFVVLKTTQSGFSGYVQDKYTTLQQTKERILSTNMSVDWTYTRTSVDYEAVSSGVKSLLLSMFFGEPKNGVWSASVQETLYQMGNAVIDRYSEIDRIRLSLPNIHYFGYNLEQFGEKFEDDVYLPTSEPHGIIAATVGRKNSHFQSKL